MSESIIVECRNLDFINSASLTQGLNPRDNGDWETIIQDKVVIEDGDNILLKNVFIDTKATTSDKIVIPDLSLKFSFMRYVMNWVGAKNTVSGGPPANLIKVDEVNSAIIPYNKTDNAVIANNDAELYVSCTKEAMNNSELRYLHSVQFKNPVGGTIVPDEFNFIFVFVDSAGVTQKKPVQVNTDNANTTILIDATFDQSKLPTGMPQPGISGGGSPDLNPHQPCGIFNAKTYPNGTEPEYKTNELFGGALAFFEYGGLNDNPFSGGGSFVPSGMKILYIVIPNSIQNNGIVTVGVLDQFKPVVDSKSVFIKGGNYDPEELCQTINRKMNETTNIGGLYDPDATPANQQDPTGGNNLLLEVGGIANKNPTLNNFVPLQFNASTAQNDDLNLYGFTYNAEGTQAATEPGLNFLGTNQVALGFDKNTQQFFFEYLHMPLFSGQNEVVGYIGENPNFPNAVDNANPPDPAKQGKVDLKAVTKNSGLLLTNLEAFRTEDGVATTDTFDFWRGQLGFDLDKFKRDANGRITSEINNNCCLVTTRQIQAAAGKKLQICGEPAMLPVSTTPLVDGINMAGGFFGLYNAVDATKSLFMNFAPIETSTFPASFKAAEITDTNPIYSKNSILALSSKTTFGYFLVEINSHFQNTLITTENTKDNVVGIVSRYYEADSFTSGGSEASVIYTHKGQPTLLSSFKCKILDPEKALAKNIGPDNTIFLEVVKNPQVDEKNKDIKKK